MKLLQLFRASLLALSIAGASGTGFSAINTGLDTYSKVVEFSQSHFDKKVVFKPGDNPPPDQILFRSAYIYAVVTGPNCILNTMLQSSPNPWASFQSKVGEWARVPTEHDDDSLYTVIIKIPETSWDLADMMEALKLHSLLYVLDAGTGFIEPTHTMFGQSMG